MMESKTFLQNDESESLAHSSRTDHSVSHYLILSATICHYLPHLIDYQRLQVDSSLFFRMNCLQVDRDPWDAHHLLPWEPSPPTWSIHKPNMMLATERMRNRPEVAPPPGV